MANTTNFGWETPDDTDLVKDGAAAMRTLGNAIDASLVDLKGGTSGQVLSKNSNTDMDFTWVTTNDADAIQNSIVDAKGDLIAASAADTPARLAVGNNGETLVANSSASVGLSYQEPKAGNPVINSAFQVWQRGTSISVSANTGTYTADRWQVYSGSTATVSRQATGDTTNLPNIQYCARVQRNSGQTNTSNIDIAQSFESVNSIPFAGKTVTLSFYARKGANYSPTSSALTVYLITGTGTDQNRLTGSYTGDNTSITTSVTLTTTWQRFVLTGTIPTTATEFCPYFSATPTGTAGAADYFEITGVQLEVGSVATPFKTQGVTLAGELGLCQRYYYRIVGDAAYAQVSGVFPAFSTTVVYLGTQLPVTMRVTPTSIDYANVSVCDGVTRTALSSLNLSGNGSTRNFGQTTATVASGLTQYRPYFLQENAGGTSAYLGFSAEL